MNTEKIEWLEKQIFLLNMKDHWDYKDFEQPRKWHEELRKLKGEA